jgi:ATP-dependent RNA helicase DDX5/DBP2
MLMYDSVDVINYDFPNVSLAVLVFLSLLIRLQNCEDYIHRIGRTGRAGAKGTSYTYFTADNSKNARELVKILTESSAVISPELQEMGMYGGGGGGRGRGGGGRGRGGGYGGKLSVSTGPGSKLTCYRWWCVRLGGQLIWRWWWRWWLLFQMVD